MKIFDIPITRINRLWSESMSIESNEDDICALLKISSIEINI